MPCRQVMARTSNPSEKKKYITNDGQPPRTALCTGRVQMLVFSNPNPGLWERKVFGTRVAVGSDATRERDHRQSQATKEDYTRHQEELSRRLRWCIDRGESFWPAHEKVHLVPGDDSQFVLGVAPWTPDGSPNPLGIPDKQMIEGPPAGFEMMPEYTKDKPDRPQMAQTVKCAKKTAVHCQKVTEMWK